MRTIGNYQLWARELQNSDGNPDPANTDIFEFTEQRYIQNNADIIINDWVNSYLLFKFSVLFLMKPNYE